MALKCTIKNVCIRSPLLLLVFACFNIQPLRAEIIEQMLPSGVVAKADYRPGNSTLPAILVLHGFLTSHNFNTIQAIVNELAEAEHTVLAPTLTLGINHRAGGLPCDAVHAHTMEDDLGEIEWWMNWLMEQGSESVVLIGHSSGSLQLVAHMAYAKPTAVKRVIATSLVYFGDAAGGGDVSRAEEMLAHGKLTPDRFFLSYCSGNYVAPPSAYLSYTRWSKERVLEAVAQIPVPVHVVLGGKDERVDADWAELLRKSRAEIDVIADANHFFDGLQEFEFLDTVFTHVRKAD